MVTRLPELSLVLQDRPFYGRRALHALRDVAKMEILVVLLRKLRSLGIGDRSRSRLNRVSVKHLQRVTQDIIATIADDLRYLIDG